MRFPGKAFFGGGQPDVQPLPALPPIPEPAVIPDPDDKQAKIAARRRASLQRQRSGRLSTINTEPQGTVLG